MASMRRVAKRTRWSCWLLAAALAVPATAAAPSEYDLKAAYLFNILRFVERRGGLPGGEYFTLGLHGAGAIEQAMVPLESSALHGRKFRIRTIHVESELAGCDAVFFGGSAARTNRILGRAAASGLLTVGNDLDFVSSGGMMAVVVESRRLVVAVNETALTSPNWSISSHLLEVARIIKGAGQ